MRIIDRFDAAESLDVVAEVEGFPLLCAQGRIDIVRI